MKTLALLLALAMLPMTAAGLRQDPVPEPETDKPETDEPAVVEAKPSPEAAAAWAAVVDATTIPGEREEIIAFDLRVEVLARQGVQSNELENVTYRYLAPNYIRFGLGTSRETGRGPGKGQSAYWLRDGDRVTKLEGRDYQQDRDLVRRMTTIAQNVIALSSPAKLTIKDLKLHAGPPAFLPESMLKLPRVKRMTWLEFQSPDFDLYKDQPAPATPRITADGKLAPPPERLFRVLIGADRKTHRPQLVALREDGEPGVAGEPLLFELKNHFEVNGFALPGLIHVRGFEPGVLPPRFQEQPAQEIGVVTADLAPALTPKDFLP